MEELEGRAPRLTSHPEIAACLWLLQTVFEVTPFTSLDRSSLGEPVLHTSIRREAIYLIMIGCPDLKMKQAQLSR